MENLKSRKRNYHNKKELIILDENGRRFVIQLEGMSREKMSQKIIKMVTPTFSEVKTP
jgi:hypothetical protein